MPKAINEMSLKFLSRSANEGFARSAAAAFVAQLDPTLDELNDIKTSVSEAVTNCIVHAYPEKVGYIWMSVKIFEGNQVQITVKDRGCGIADVEKARQPMFTTGGSERSGMGFTIMESFMDTFKIKSAEAHGTTVTMAKKLSVRLGAGRNPS